MNEFDKIVHQLSLAEIESPRLEARLLLAAATNRLPEEIFSDIVLSSAEQQKLQQMLNERLQHKPLDKILGHREFYKSDFAVNESVLSPRPDTEILVEETLRLLPNENANILDLGTGSGCIIESILLEKPQTSGIAVDISAESLKIARQNAEKLGLSERLKLLQADWFDTDFVRKINQKFEIIVSNPPYIPSAEITTLAPEVKNYDPLLALDGGADGFVCYRRIAEIAPELLNTSGYILLEAGIGQAEKIAEIFEQNGLKHVATAADLNGVARCVILQKDVAKSKIS